MSKTIKWVLAGLPNVGKTTLFNRISGEHRHTGNWAGVTVDQHAYRFNMGQQPFSLNDLPGILCVYDQGDQVDHMVAKKEISRADLVINVVDGRAIHRDLVLSLQLLCYQKPMVCVITHEHEAMHLEGIKKALPAPVILASEFNIVKLVEQSTSLKVPDIDQLIDWPIGFSQDWNRLSKFTPLEKINRLIQNGEHPELGPYDVLIAEGFFQTAATQIDRYGCRKPYLSNRNFIDQWVLDAKFGFPIFFCMMYLIFSLTIGVGGALGEALSQLVLWVVQSLSKTSLFGVLVHSLAMGLATCLGFVPLLMIMYLLLGCLEQSGYMSRVALLSDILMKPLGLSGQSFIPMLLGFGCNVPAVLATRVVTGKAQRMLTALMIPFMPCSARLSIFVIFAAAFFPHHGASVIMCLYVMGVGLGVFTIWLASHIWTFSQQGQFSIELPEYRWPEWQQLWFSTRLKVFGFIKRALPLIVGFSSLLTLLGSVDMGLHIVSPESSILANIGLKMVGWFSFMGIESHNWQAVVALMSGLVAKEVIIATLNGLYMLASVNDTVLTLSGIIYEALEQIVSFPFLAHGAPVEQAYTAYFSPASAFAYMVFVLLYFPCISTLVALKNEFGQKIAWFSFVWTSLLAVWASRIAYWGIQWFDIMSIVLVGLIVFYQRGNDDTVACKSLSD